VTAPSGPSGSTNSTRSIDLPSLQRGEIRDPALTAALRKLELTVRRKLDGVLHGDHLGLLPGPGTEPGESRSYQPGDDVRRMDWSVTARTTQPHVRQMIADRELETWLVVDVSASLDFGTAGCEKRDLAVAAAAAIAFLNSGGGNRLGAIISNGDTMRRVPALSGRMHEQELLRAIATTPRAPMGTRGDLAAAIDALRRPERRRGMAVIISDFLGPIDWMRPLRAISGRHEVLGIEILDPRDIELPPVGDVILQDTETGRTREFTIDEQLRSDFERAAAAHRAEVARTLVVGEPSDAVTALYRRRDELWDMLVAACRPGTTTSALLDAYQHAGEELPAMPVAHGLGLGFDPPVVSPGLRATAESNVLEEGMVLALTAYVWEQGVGAVLTRDAVLITADGAEILSTVPAYGEAVHG
jgi:hypothetical protein